MHILDLPDEILLEIFEHVEDFDANFPFPHEDFLRDDEREDVRSLRLVCRRFADASSQLLVRVVRVHANEPSIARLEAISRHPTIAKGVRFVRVVFHLYNASFADFDWFFISHADELADQIDSFRYGGVWPYTDPDEQTASA